MGLVPIVALLALAAGAVPSWPFSPSRGYCPSRARGRGLVTVELLGPVGRP
jgi:hypothetical protein